MTVRANQLAALASAIERVRRFDVPADNGLRAFFRAHPEMGQHDRAFVAEGVFALLRRMRSLEALAATAEPRKLAIAVLVREQGRSLRDLEPALRTADEAFLREFKSRLHDPLPPAVAHDLPDWLWERLGTAYGDDGADCAGARVGRAGSVRPARESAEDDARRGTRGARRGRVRRHAHALFAAGHPRRRTRGARAASVARRRPARSAGRRQPARRLRRGAEAQRHGRGFLRGRRRQDAAAGCADALAGPPLRVRRRAKAPCQPGAAPEAFGAVQRPSAGARPASATPRSSASRERSTAYWSTRRAPASARCAAIPISSGGSRNPPSRNWRPSRPRSSPPPPRWSSRAGAWSTRRAACCRTKTRRSSRSSLPPIPQFAAGNAAADLARAHIALDTGPTLQLLPHRHGCDGFFAAVLERSAHDRLC